LITFLVAVTTAVILVFGVYSHGKVLSPSGNAGRLDHSVIAVDPIDRIRRKAFSSAQRHWHDVAHIGLGMFVLSVTTVESFTLERDVALGQGEQTTVATTSFASGRKAIEGPNYNGV